MQNIFSTLGYELQTTTGRVLSANKNLETQAHGGGNRNSVQISSTTTTHDQIFLIDKNGKEHAFKLVDMDVACREGNELSILWAGKRNLGYDVAVKNNTTNQYFFADSRIRKMLMPWKWVYIAMALGFVYGLITDGAFTFMFVAALIGIIVAYVASKMRLNQFKTEFQSETLISGTPAINL